MDSLGETMLMCARCVGAYHRKVPAQLPSPSGTNACPEDGVRARENQDLHLVKPSSIPQKMRSGWHQVQEVYKKELDLAGKANPPRGLGFLAELDFRFSSNQVIKFCKT